MTTRELDAIIAENVARVRRQMADAAVRAGRDAGDVRLVAVTKYVGTEEIRSLVRAGCTLLGENRPQQLAAKAEALRDEPIRWHMIGPVQRNKIRRTLPLVEMIESADSLRMIEAVDRVAGELSLQVPILLEVNVSGDASKHGFSPDLVVETLKKVVKFPHVQIKGLMCMAAFDGGLDVARRDFRRLRMLREEIRKDGFLLPKMDLFELSMGMSHDFKVAIEEGATIVRIGSALFEGIG
ncbi:MAG: YggS family pyridoxal phosphate-dependent enzyme [Pirellulales bacterium]|nr:YggS family pyridoxal phosphate-dependent enzyme [Pirellulales bacterium]